MENNFTNEENSYCILDILDDIIIKNDDMFLVVTYDVPDNKRRQKLAKFLKGYGYRVQKSVFECILSPEKVRKLFKEISEKIKPEEDSLRIYELKNRSKVTSWGVVDRLYEEDEDFYFV